MPTWPSCRRVTFTFSEASSASVPQSAAPPKFPTVAGTRTEIDCFSTAHLLLLDCRLPSLSASLDFHACQSFAVAKHLPPSLQATLPQYPKVCFTFHSTRLAQACTI